MNRIVALCVIFCIGCGHLTTSVDNQSKPSVVVDEPASATEVFMRVAKLVDNGTLSTTKDLAEFVLIVANNGDLSQADAVKFDSAFPGATTNSRELTKSDSATLRGIK